MRKIILFLFLTSTFYTFSQKKKSEFKQPFPYFKSCMTSVTPSECFNSIVKGNILSLIEIDVKEHLIGHAKKEPIFVYVSFIIDDNGKPIKESIKTTKIKNNPLIEEKLISAITDLPKIYPKTNEFNHPILSNYHLTISFGLDNDDNVVILEDSNEPRAFLKNCNYTAPIYPKCKASTNKALKKCFSNKMTKLIVKKYNYKKAIKGFKKKGSFYTYVTFVVSKQGEINKYLAFGPNKNFEKEALRSLKRVKDLKPGTYNGKPVNISFAIPLVLKLE